MMVSRMHSFATWVLLLLLVVVPVLLSQTPAPLAVAPDPAPLAVARANFLRQVMAESQTLTEQYERALARLELELAEAADYEEARLVQQRRQELKALYAGMDSSQPQSPALPLLPAQARLLGSAETRGEYILGWRTNNSGVEWANMRLSPGRYHLELEANLVELPSLPGTLVPGRAQPQETAVFDFFEVSLLPGASENRRSFEVRLSPDDTTFQPVKVGPVNFTRSLVTLRLVAPTGYPGNLLRLRNVRLVPVNDSGPQLVTSPEDTGPGLEALRNSLTEELTAAQKPVTDLYLERLRALSSSSPELRDAISSETKRVLKLLENSHGQAGGPFRLLVGHGGLNGFEDLDGAYYVLDTSNRGDLFWIEHEGKRRQVRLLWVACAPTEASQTAAASAFAKHFSLGNRDVTYLGRVAQEFTAGYLTGKALRVLVRPTANKDGSFPALVFLPDIGLFQNVLVDQGLAAVIPQKERRGMMESGLYESLAAREKSAQRQQPPPGAWGLGETQPSR